jgi:hypothetical protein
MFDRAPAVSAPEFCVAKASVQAQGLNERLTPSTPGVVPADT